MRHKTTHVVTAELKTGSLVSLGLQLREARAEVPPGPGDLAGRLEAAVSEVTDVLEELREIAHGLHPGILSTAGLRPAQAPPCESTSRLHARPD
jgi:signal transduction histidine kinase